MRASILQKQKQSSPLKSQRRIQAGGAVAKGKTLFFSLNLTTLIDAFCILVIFLLSNMNSQLQNLQTGKNLVLPTTVRNEALLDTDVVVRVEQNTMFLNNLAISKEDIAKVLLQAKKTEKTSLVIQADKNSDYENIGLILRAGGQAGYEKYVFAVLPGV